MGGAGRTRGAVQAQVFEGFQ